MNLKIIGLNGKRIADAEGGNYDGILDAQGPIANRPVAILAYELNNSPLSIEDFCAQYAGNEEEAAKLVEELKSYLASSNETGIGDSKKERISKKKLNDACDPGYDEDLYAMSQEFMNSNKSIEDIVREHYDESDVEAVTADLMDFMDVNSDKLSDSKISDGLGANIKSAMAGAVAGWRNNRKYLFKHWLKDLENETAIQILEENPKFLAEFLEYEDETITKMFKVFLAEYMKEAEYADNVYKALKKYGLADVNKSLNGTLKKEQDKGGLVTRATNAAVNKGRKAAKKVATTIDEAFES